MECQFTGSALCKINYVAPTSGLDVAFEYTSLRLPTVGRSRGIYLRRRHLAWAPDNLDLSSLFPAGAGLSCLEAALWGIRQVIKNRAIRPVVALAAVHQMPQRIRHGLHFRYLLVELGHVL